MTTVALSLKNLPSLPPGGLSPDLAPPSPLLWEITAEWNREETDPDAFTEDLTADTGVERDWWRVYVKVGI